MAPALHACAIRRGKTRSIVRYGPRTWLIRGIYLISIPCVHLKTCQHGNHGFCGKLYTLRELLFQIHSKELRTTTIQKCQTRLDKLLLRKPKYQQWDKQTKNIKLTKKYRLQYRQSPVNSSREHHAAITWQSRSSSREQHAAITWQRQQLVTWTACSYNVTKAAARRVNSTPL